MAKPVRPPVTTGRRLPYRFIVYGPEGAGKTSFGAQFPDPVFIQARGETGLASLMQAGQLPDDVPHFPEEAETWADLLAQIQWLESNGDHKTLVLDTLDCAERLNHIHTCATYCEKDWGKFEAFKRGYELALEPWREFLVTLDRLRTTRGLRIVLLAHSKVEKARNPAGEDYSQHVGNVHRAAWSLLKGWSDAVLFLQFEIAVSKKGKATGGATRGIHPTHDAAYDAKNRFGLDEIIPCGNSPQEAFVNFTAAMADAAKKGKGD